MHRLIFALLLTLAMFPRPSFAASDVDIDHLSSYAVLLGRGVACGQNVDAPSRSVGAWIDRTWSGSEKGAMLKVFMLGMENAAKMQRDGKTPDSCSKVRDVLNTTPWP